jgi:hypothetical protein
MEEEKTSLQEEPLKPELPYPLPMVPSEKVNHVNFKSWDFYFTNEKVLDSKSLDRS